MAKRSINVDERVWEQAKAVFSQLGLNASSGIEVYLRQVVRDGALPFRPTLTEEELRQTVSEDGEPSA